jgi:hypothetical protein
MLPVLIIVLVYSFSKSCLTGKNSSIVFFIRLHASLASDNAIYQMPIGNNLVLMNELIGQEISLTFNGEITCSNCGTTTRKSYSQGYCFPCCRDLARCDLCIMKPETCHHHLGTCREPLWGLDNCFAPHIIYLANSSGVKVGITRKSNMPSRWIDQGAVQALPILEVDTRLKSGQIEVALKAFVNDKTNWRKMLKNEVDATDLVAKKQLLLAEVAHLTYELNFLILRTPVSNNKYCPLMPCKTPEISGVLSKFNELILLGYSTTG